MNKLSNKLLSILFILITAISIIILSYKGLDFFIYEYITGGTREISSELSTKTTIIQEVPYQRGDLGLSFIFSTQGHKITGDIMVKGVGKTSGSTYFNKTIHGKDIKNNEFIDFPFSLPFPKTDETIIVTFSSTSEPGFGVVLLTTAKDSLPEHQLLVDNTVMSDELVTRRIRINFTGQNLFCLLNIIIVSLSGIYAVCNILKTERYAIYYKKSKSYYITLFFLVIVFCGLSYTESTQLLWDSHEGFHHFCEFETKSYIKSLGEISNASHISYAYSFVGFILVKIFKTAYAAQTIYGKLLAIAGVYGFWKLIHIVYRNKNEYLLGFATLVYILSPYISGMASYNWLDTTLWHIIPLLTYLLYTDKIYSTVICVLYFLFTKEPAIVIYAPLLAGIYLLECLETRKIFHNIMRYLCLTMPALLWLIAYYSCNHWVGYGAFLFSRSYVLTKTSSLFLVNFNYLFLFLSVISIGFTLFNNSCKKYRKYLLPTALSMFVFYIFSVNFFTHTHPRYIDSMITQLYFAATFVPLALIKNKYNILLLSVECVFLGISIFRTIDPIMLSTFTNVNIGDTVMITANEVLSDGMVYNRQYQDFGYAMDKALDEICTDNKNIIFYPAGIYKNAFFFNAIGGFSNVPPEGEITLTNNWNPDRKTRITSLNENNTLLFKVHVIGDDYKINLENNETGYYYYMDSYGAEKAEKIRKEKTVLEESFFTSRGWVIKRIKFID